MTQSNLIEQAKQGNVKVIAALMNRLLKPQGMMADVGRSNDCLEILIESDKRSLTDKFRTPNKKVLVDIIKKWLIALGIVSISRVRISWQRSGQDRPAWTQEFELIIPLDADDQETVLISTDQLSSIDTNKIDSFEANLQDDATIVQSVRYQDFGQFSEIPVGLTQNNSVAKKTTALTAANDSEYLEHITQDQLDFTQIQNDKLAKQRAERISLIKTCVQYALASAAIVGIITGIHYLFAHSQTIKENTKAVIQTEKLS